MSDLIEIVFENIPFEILTRLLEDPYVPKKDLIHCRFSSEKTTIADKALPLDLKSEVGGDFDLFMNFKKIETNSFYVPCPSVNIIRRSKVISVCFIFDLDTIIPKTPNLTEALFTFSKDFSVKYGSLNYYAGIEPAFDEETRFFTNEEFGPISLA